MSPLAIAATAFACIFGGALLGMALRRSLPEHHLSSDSKEVVKLGMGLVSTMSALVLGLLTASAKTSFDTQDAAVKESAVNVILLDRLLARYGPEAAGTRDLLRQVVAYRLQVAWPEQGTPGAAATPPVRPPIEGVEDQVRRLAPQTDGQRWLQGRALEITEAELHTRWMLLEHAATQMQAPLLVSLVVWLSALFASFGLFAHPNGTVTAVLLVSAASVAAALFLILEMQHPFGGLIRISGEPVRLALEQLHR